MHRIFGSYRIDEVLRKKLEITISLACCRTQLERDFGFSQGIMERSALPKYRWSILNNVSQKMEATRII